MPQPYITLPEVTLTVPRATPFRMPIAVVLDDDGQTPLDVTGWTFQIAYRPIWHQTPAVDLTPRLSAEGATVYLDADAATFPESGTFQFDARAQDQNGQRLPLMRGFIVVERNLTRG